MVEIPPMQDFAGFERETERELAGLKGNGADTAAPAPLPPRTDENVHVADFNAGAKKLNGSGSNELVTEDQAGLRLLTAIPDAFAIAIQPENGSNGRALSGK